jgi:hypothetical protein
MSRAPVLEIPHASHPRLFRTLMLPQHVGVG